MIENFWPGELEMRLLVVLVLVGEDAVRSISVGFINEYLSNVLKSLSKIVR